MNKQQNTMHHDHTFVYADEVKKYKTHHLTRPGHSKTSDNDENAAFQEHKGKESLVNKCIRTIAVNFDKNPNIDGLPEKLLPKLEYNHEVLMIIVLLGFIFFIANSPSSFV